VTTVANVLRSKPDQSVHTITRDTTVFEAVRRMAEHNLGALVVVDGSQVVGMFTERDYARRVALMARTSKETPVADVMTSPVLCVSPDRTSEECLALMTERRIRHLPVMDQGKLTGLISIGDLVKDIISEQQFTIDQLEHYIMGAR
jgi:CBS domain-containing protein